MIRQEISRRTPAGCKAAGALAAGQTVSDEVQLGVLRRWFWTRKPDAGFVLADFPATLLQAKVFDEWLDARGADLTACVVSTFTRPAESILDHYRTHGVDLIDAADLFTP